MKHKKTDPDIKKEITLETFKSYLKIHVKDISETKWNHLENVVNDIQEILDSDSYGPFTKNVYDMKMIYETLLNKIKDKTVFDNDSLDSWKLYYILKNKPKETDVKPLNYRKVQTFINLTFEPKIIGCTWKSTLSW